MYRGINSIRIGNCNNNRIKQFRLIYVLRVSEYILILLPGLRRLLLTTGNLHQELVLGENENVAQGSLNNNQRPKHYNTGTNSPRVINSSVFNIKNMKICVLLSIILIGAIAIRPDNKSTQKHVESLAQTHWGRTLLSMMSLHSLSAGPVEELVTAIEDLQSDLAAELAQLEHDFETRTHEHNSLTLQLEQEIATAAVDYQRAVDTIENLLKPRRDQLKNKIDNLTQFKEGNRKTLAETQHKRELEHEEFVAQIEEFNSAIEATDQALQLLETLTNPTLAQIKQVHITLHNIENKVRPHSKQAPIIKALIALASEQNFADQGIIGSIAGKLNEFRNSVVDAMNLATFNEGEAENEFKERCVQLEAEYAEFGRQISRITIDLDATNDKINELNEYAAQRDADRQRYQAQLDIENDTYAAETKIYTDLKNQYLREQAVVEEAHKVVKSADFSNIKI